MKKTIMLGVYIAMTLAVVGAPIMANAGILPYAAYGETSASANGSTSYDGHFGSVSASGPPYGGNGTASGTGSASYSNGSGSASGSANSSVSYPYYPYSLGSGSGLFVFELAVIGPASVFETLVPVDFTASGTASTSANMYGFAQASASFGAALYQGINYLGTGIGTSIGACDSPSGGCPVASQTKSFSFVGHLNVDSSYFSGSNFYSLTQAVVDLQAGCGTSAGGGTGVGGSASCTASVDPMAYIVVPE